MFLARLPRLVGIALIRLYQWTLSPLLGASCRFEPSCSRYACTCLEHHGLLRGSWLTAKRLSRCHPWHGGGYDPAPVAGSRSGAACSRLMPRALRAPEPVVTICEASHGEPT